MSVEDTVKKALNNIEKTLEKLYSAKKELQEFLRERMKEKQ